MNLTSKLSVVLNDDYQAKVMQFIKQRVFKNTVGVGVCRYMMYRNRLKSLTSIIEGHLFDIICMMQTYKLNSS